MGKTGLHFRRISLAGSVRDRPPWSCPVLEVITVGNDGGPEEWRGSLPRSVEIRGRACLGPLSSPAWAPGMYCTTIPQGQVQSSISGALGWLSYNVKRPMLDLGSGCDLAVHGFEPCVRACLDFSLPLPPPPLTLTRSQNKHLKFLKSNISVKSVYKIIRCVFKSFPLPKLTRHSSHTEALCAV